MPLVTEVRETAPERVEDGILDLRTAGGDGGELAERLLDASLVLVARWGVGKTSLADVAKEAGCSRATVYRAFPGGKQHLFEALGRRELRSYLLAVLDAVDAADDLEDATTRALVVATRLLRDHDAARFVLDHEPGLLLPFLGFKQVDVLHAHTATVLGPRLERFLPADRAAWLAEWCARLFLSYLFQPDPDVDLAEPADARALLAGLVLPAFASPVPTPH